MNNTERIYKIHQMLTNHQVVSTKQFMAELQVSLATLKRDLSFLKDRLNAPLKYDHELGGYCFEGDTPVGPKYEVPGLWFNDSELHALMTIQNLLKEVQPNLLTPYLQPLHSKLNAILCSMKDSPEEISNRVLIMAAGRRQHNLKHFEIVASATIRRHRLSITHFNRGVNDATQRVVSPQQLVYYKDNWYVDCWCHLRKGIRSFSIDAITSAELMTEKAKEIPIKKLRAELGEGYGIFNGKAVQWAKLRFGPVASRWVSKRNWHSEQKSSFDESGNLLLEVPFSDERELLQDILAWLPDVEVLAPPSLQNKIKEVLEQSLKKIPTTKHSN